MTNTELLRIGILSISDRASMGVYEDKGLPALKEWFDNTLENPLHFESCLIADEQELIEKNLIHLADHLHCSLIVTTGGTGPAKRDVTPEATLNVAEKVLDGFGEQMRRTSLQYVPTAILSRQVAVIRGHSLIINLPGQPKAIKETLDGIFAAVPYCIDIIGGPYITTKPDTVTIFRPKSALRPGSNQ
ncbi:MAG: molybdopterin adenylyltransferase [Ferrovum sp. 37-45-19]|jgi:molybdopterin adenylyltransferase|nr:MAG: molybdopterin adenylyltransferase [Ferrovum sp. 21-44-67]OYV95460.1 MAG: molybdopterin adenylyltransferase [Ferrovum sp. 37-45-19]OZB31508.1 MAG: molybdopterin adenylyltransferase [Ferrovum sp. 34-44-207]HQT81255.1 molybdopterin adenylyltransferase [Ferrovaceae bacterium]HQU05708.1 molybdopterin adenylyltransferase [Ferrovaceae bacterium]